MSTPNLNISGADEELSTHLFLLYRLSLLEDRIEALEAALASYTSTR